MELVMDLAVEEHFRLDFVMTNQSYVHEWGNLGWIYLQIFPSMKMYAGQSINIVDRFKKYKSFCGSNPHHSNALKRYGWENIQKIVVEVPKFLLNRIECFLIEWYDLTNTSKGYNKTTGGRIGYHMSLATRKKMSQSKLGENHHMYGKTHSDVTKKKISQSLSGENNPNFGKTFSNDHKEKMRQANLGKTLSDDHKEKLRQANLGKTLSDDTKNKIRQTKLGKTLSDSTKEKVRQANLGSNNHNAKPVVAFGKLFECARIASDYWRSEKAPKNKRGNFIVYWMRSKKYPQDVFYVSKEFYELYKDSDENITREMYDSFK